ncbi:hypothetical protein BC830DRAFT_1079671 [Chytriomyces sp. MP71]|nr:hypothetical protein BC830DRAFT_1079671 [Chytriomyces sp. MP71]
MCRIVLESTLAPACRTTETRQQTLRKYGVKGLQQIGLLCAVATFENTLNELLCTPLDQNMEEHACQVLEGTGWNLGPYRVSWRSKRQSYSGGDRRSSILQSQRDKRRESLRSVPSSNRIVHEVDEGGIAHPPLPSTTLRLITRFPMDVDTETYAAQDVFSCATPTTASVATSFASPALSCVHELGTRSMAPRSLAISGILKPLTPEASFSGNLRMTLPSNTATPEKSGSKLESSPSTMKLEHATPPMKKEGETSVPATRKIYDQVSQSSTCSDSFQSPILQKRSSIDASKNVLSYTSKYPRGVKTKSVSGLTPSSHEATQLTQPSATIIPRRTSSPPASPLSKQFKNMADYSQNQNILPLSEAPLSLTSSKSSAKSDNSEPQNETPPPRPNPTNVTSSPEKFRYRSSETNWARGHDGREIIHRRSESTSFAAAHVPRYLLQILNFDAKRSICFSLHTLLFCGMGANEYHEHPYLMSSTDKRIIGFIYFKSASNNYLAAHFAALAHACKVPAEVLQARLKDAQAFHMSSCEFPTDIVTAAQFLAAKLSQRHVDFYDMAPKLMPASRNNPWAVMEVLGLFGILGLLQRYSAVVDDGLGLEKEVAELMAGSYGRALDFDAEEKYTVNVEALGRPVSSDDGNLWGGNVQY